LIDCRRISDFFSHPHEITASERSSHSDPPISPFYKIFFFDAQIPKEYKQLLSGGFDFDSLKTRKPEKTLYMLGRPLWPSLMKSNKFDASGVLKL
jgi:hypothetical protein